MATKKAGLIAGLAVAGIAVGGLLTATAAFADPTAAPTTPAASAPADGTQQGRGPGGPAMHEHTAVTGDEAQKVIDAVKAKFADADVTTVEKDPDGSYDARGTTGMYEVSADLATVTQGGPGGPGGKGGRGPGGHEHTAVTGDEAQKVIDAVKAKNPDAAVTTVEKDPDGSYDVRGSSFEVSSDLQTVTETPKR